ncbi:MAG TPA: hypothetical protein O0X79_04195, partial [Methanocorpusculum sp.]|nr:hypothetical protein [Methanocorpusculum sp.]
SKKNESTEKPARGFFLSIFQERVRFLRRRSAGAEHPNVRKMRFALIRGGVQAEGLRAASNEQSSFGLIRGSFSHSATLGHTLPEFDPPHTA